MEAIGKRTRLEKAKERNEKIKLIFQYPSSERAVIKSGYVLECYDDSFSFDDIYDGEVTYSYNYLVEIKEVREK
jgi:hypothetical protein